MTITATLALTAALVVALMALTWYAARLTGRWAVVDVTWGLGFAAIAVLVAALAGSPRGWLLCALVVLWAGRLAWHIFRRGRGHGEDPRYQALKERNPSFTRAVLLPQGLAMWFVSLPVQVGAFGEDAWSALTGVGVLVWAVGMFFEAPGDAQLARFKADPDNRGRVMDRGLWAWTRHPNYFGDACLWWGIWLVAADSGLPGVLTVASPLAMTFFLRNVTGARLLEQTMMRRPGYPEYAARTPMFFPRPPRRA